ncbi:SusC/RagA family TonB-linked outer membrane protein [Mucilaginibacter sp. 14171R-50]|uniref:SusC/RagA family TonB-linked outer membrane protein n=1 Tax=Mucilaginibacter sp. 14171R-50 TaxID=2703789 RepID=UPI00138C0147|nr:SusC/RagA family TonB-linked outer membrane protein [Mucilaginibacter sp. 14171R-50]QHS56324.1 SusC/RagA family TonB-linked outer membrane protein [Mucilaginibacter sp. 14171R-50]
MKQMYLRCIALLLFSIVSMAAYAQKTVTGRVTEKSGEPLPGVTVAEKGTANGMSTTVDGKFSISVKQGAVLSFSFIGYKTKEVTVGAENTINVVLESGDNALNEVVVTALGIKREKKSLGYAVQEVKGQTLSDTKEPNVVNALSGKVAGLQITRSGNGPGGSSRITLRGNNSLTGSNQPLIVVDGIPLDNFIGAANNDYYNPSLDMGNGLSDINAEDIESMSVLKGAAAAALYGSRAGNGAILITTKTGKTQNGLGITLTSSVGIESIFARAKTQNVFGQGTNGIYDATSSSSWGPKATGQNVTKWDGTEAPLATYDNIGSYFGNGLTSNQGISFQQQYKSTSVYTSYNRLDDKSIIPGAKLTRNNLMARTVSKFGAEDKWTVDTKVQYINSAAFNRPQGGSNVSNNFYALSLLPTSINIRDFSARTNEAGKMLWWRQENELNPYWASKYNLNEDIRNRFLLNGSVRYQFNSWLSAEAKGGADTYTTNTTNMTYSGATPTSTGSYGTGKSTFTETNYSTLLTAKKDNIFGKLGGVITAGGNLMNRKSSYLSANVGTLQVPDLFSLNNGTSSASINEGINRHNIYSVYGSVGLNYDGYLFLDGTFRNDWSSALIAANRSYFYPSLSGAFVFTELMSKSANGLPSWLTYGKLRGSFAAVGNDMEPYQLYNTYTIGKDPLGNTTASRGDVLYDPYVKSELIKSYEAGLEMRFFNSRLGFDFAVYKSNATRQLLNLPMDNLSGYSFKKINAGDIENKGLELMVDGKILQSSTGFNWNAMVNFSINRNRVKYLTDEVTRYGLGGFDDVSVIAETGQLFGEIYGSRFLRVKDASSEYNGKLILDATGLPQVDPEKARLGNQQATSLLGVTNSFSYKNFDFSFLIDARFGGQVFSGTIANMEQYGTSNKTVVNGSRDNMLVDGVVLNTTTNKYEPNKVETSAQNYWGVVAGHGNIGITEANLYDASNVRVRNVQLGYNLPKSLLSGSGIQRAKIGVSANNLWLISSHMNGMDPESVYATGTNATGFESGSSPTTRTFLLNLTIGF